MDPATVAILAGLGSVAFGQLLAWLLARSGRQINGRKDLREELTALWNRISELEKEVGEWRDRYTKLQTDYEELTRRYHLLVIELAAVKLAGTQK
jgi:predicted nuclease with TOPRIM domain